MGPAQIGMELPVSSEDNYVGVFLDQKLSWRRKRKRGLNALYSCRNSIVRR